MKKGARTCLGVFLVILLVAGMLIVFPGSAFADDLVDTADTSETPVTVTAVDSDPTHFTYNSLAMSTCEVTGYTGSSAQIAIPGTSNTGKVIVGIADYAFMENTTLTSVSMPNSVTYIGAFAFINCANLSSVTLSNNLNQIRDSAFANCAKLTFIELPNFLSEIRYGTFLGTGLTSIYIPDSVTTLGGSVFYNCLSLQTARLPVGLGTIPNSTFMGDTALTNITLPNNYTSVEAHAFSSSGITSITFPNGLTSIGDYAFNSCHNLTSVTFPDNAHSNLDTIGVYAFSGSERLNNIVLPNGVELMEGAFGNCLGLTNITLPEDLSSIGKYVLYGTRFTSIIIPETVSFIDELAFYSCTNLQSVTLPEGVDSVSHHAFQDCTNLKRITIPNADIIIGASVFLYDNALNDSGGGICGFAGSKVEEYANNNGFNFLSIHTVTFESNGGSAVKKQYVVNNEKAIEPSAPTYPGDTYVFDAWYNNIGLTQVWDFTDELVDHDLTLYAKWLTPRTVTFYSEPGTVFATQTVGDGKKAMKPDTNPNKTGYTFGCWCIDTAGDNEYDFNTVVTADTDIYAKWLLNYTVTFNSQGGSKVASVEVGDGLTFNEPAQPTRSGYTFGGWYKEPACVTPWNFTTDVVTTATTLYAKWNAKSTYLKGITLSPGAVLTKTFSKTRYSYTVKVNEDTDSVKITPVPQNSHATVKINNVVQSDITVSLPKKGDTKTVKVKVSMSGKTSRTYTLTVTRTKSSDNLLADLTPSIPGGATLNFSGKDDPGVTVLFDPLVAEYYLRVDENTGSVIITPTRHDIYEKIYMDGVYINGTTKTGRTYNVETGYSKTCKIKVYAQNGSPPRTYTVKIMRAPCTDAYLSKIKTNSSSYPVTPVFDKGTAYYAVFLPDSVSSVTLYATKENEYATVRFNGVKASSKTYSVANGASLPPVDIQVTAQDGTTIQHYYVTINRAPRISSFSASPKYGSYPSISPGGDNRLTFKWTQKGGGDITIDILNVSVSGGSWQNIYSGAALAAGEHNYVWDGITGGTYAAGKYKARVRATDEYGTSSYKYLYFKVLKKVTPTISASKPNIPYGGTQYTKLTVKWDVFTKVNVRVYDSSFNLVAELWISNGYLSPGTKTLYWYGKYDAARGGTAVPAGDYRIRVSAQGNSADAFVTVTPAV